MWEVDTDPWEAQMEQRCSHAQEIQTMIPGKDNQSVRSMRMETVSQKWSNLMYKAYYKSCPSMLCSFA
jgi:hypothetical protein